MSIFYFDSDRLFNCLQGVYVGDKRSFLIQGDSSYLFNWEENGIIISVPRDTLSPTESSQVEVVVLVGGQFQLPEGTELVSAVYGITLSKPLLKPIKLEIQHCLHLVTQDDINCLNFATAPVGSGLPYQFQLKDGGQFSHGETYGSIWLSEFSLVTFVQKLFRRSPVCIYVGKTFYEEKKRYEWLMRFLVTRDLNALDKVSVHFIVILSSLYYIIVCKTISTTS